MAPLLLDSKPAWQSYQADDGTSRRPTRDRIVEEYPRAAGRQRTETSETTEGLPGASYAARHEPPPVERDRSFFRGRSVPRRTYTTYESRAGSVFREEYDGYRSRSRVRSDDSSGDEVVVVERRIRSKRKLRSSDSTRNLVINFNLGSKASTSDRLRWNPKIKSWSLPTQLHSSTIRTRLNVLSSTCFSAHSGESLVELKCDTEWGMQESCFLRWTHLQQPSLNFEEFEQIATRLEGLSEEMLLVIDHLLANVRKELERTYVHGKYLAPGAIRCDGRDHNNSKREDVTALFTCMPFFDFQDLRAATGTFPRRRENTNLHPTRSLLQWQYDSESTRERDASQTLKVGSNKTLHVPTIWTLVIGSEALLTAAPVSMQDLMKPDVVKLEKPLNPDKSRMVQVSDPYKRHYFFPMDSCKTFFELRQIVQSHCLEDIGLDESACDFLLDSGEALQTARWIEIVNNHTPALTLVTVVEKEETRKMMAIADSEDIRRVGEKKTEATFRDRNSADGGDAPWNNDPKAWQLDVRRDARGRPKRRDDRSSKAVKALERQGLVVNDPDSLTEGDDTKNKGAEGVTMFQLERPVTEGTKHEAAGTQGHGRYAPTEPPIDTTENGHGRPSSKTETKRKSATGQPGTTQSNDPPKLTLRIPPFLSWRLAEDADTQRSANRQNADLTVLSQILGSLEKKLYSRDHDVSEGSGLGSVVDEFKFGKSYRETDEKLYSQLKTLVEDFKLAETDSDTTTELSKEAPEEGSNTRSSGVVPFTDPNHLLVRQRERDIHKLVTTLVKLSEEIVSCFAPVSYDSQVLRKVWGSLTSLLAVNTPSQALNSDKGSIKGGWVIREVVRADASEADVPVPSRQFRDCSQCSNFETYDSSPEAIRHLVSTHYVGRITFNAGEMKAIETTVVRTVTMAKLQTTREVLKHLNRIYEFMITLHARVYDMVEGLAHVNEEDPTAALTFGLPSSLVRAFEHFFNFLTAAARVMPIMERNFSGWTPSNALGWHLRMDDYALLVGFLGFRADVALSNAMKDIVLLIRTGEASDAVNYTAVGPRYIAFTFIRSLLLSKLSDADGIVEICTKKTSNLQYQVLHRPPRRRLLADIQALQEEITAVRDIRYQQDDCMWETMELCAPGSFRITSRSRTQQYALEYDVAVPALRDKLGVESTALGKLLTRLKTLEEKARHRIEVLEEDNSKTIFVFTVVTAVFLPLSFVTSYLGMNTVDIRDTTTSQSTFWAIALPVTAVVVALAILAAYKGDALVEWIGDMREAMRKRRSVRGGFRRRLADTVIRLIVRGPARKVKRRSSRHHATSDDEKEVA